MTRLSDLKGSGWVLWCRSFCPALSDAEPIRVREGMDRLAVTSAPLAVLGE